MRYRLELSYSGKNFHGWQRQPNADTVQQTLEDAFLLIFKDKFEIVGCGRTDTGVHARSYTAHFDSKNQYDESTVNKLNSYLPDSIAIESIAKVKDDFHARFDAKSRSYEYYITTVKNPFLTEQSWYIPQNLDVELMNDAAKVLLEHNDFTSFSKLHTDVKTNNCEIQEAYFKMEDNVLTFRITADRFLRNMVRAIVGTLVLIGKNKINKQDFIDIIKAKDRGRAGQSAPAQGLFLHQILY